MTDKAKMEEYALTPSEVVEALLRYLNGKGRLGPDTPEVLDIDMNGTNLTLHPDGSVIIRFRREP